jgi:nucleoid-associated protein YgaU
MVNFAFCGSEPYATPDSHLYDTEFGYYNLGRLGHTAIMMGFSAPVAAAAGLVALLAMEQQPQRPLDNDLSAPLQWGNVPEGPQRAFEQPMTQGADLAKGPQAAAAVDLPPREDVQPPAVAEIQSVAETEAAVEKAPEAAPQITIKPGNSLWALSRELYGAGRNYLTLLNANKDKIADPKLIYPGQVLAAPKRMEN